MQDVNIPAKFPIPFGANAGSGFIRNIPTASQIGVVDGAASLTDGFPPLNFQPESAGGVPPAGADMNGILYAVTAWIRWLTAGGPLSYDAAFASAIGGYPKGAWLTSAAGGSWWVSTVDNNTSNPDAGGANWTSVSFGALAALGVGLGLKLDATATKLTLNPADSSLRVSAGGVQVSEPVTHFAGTVNLTAQNNFGNFIGSGSINLPKASTLWNGYCILANATGGAIVLTPNSADAVAGGSAGASYTLPQGAIALVICDDTGSWSLALQAGTPSSNTGTVAAVSGATTVGHVAVYSDLKGTLVDGGPLNSAGGSAITSSGNITPGVYYVNTSGGPITLTLPTAIVGTFTFIDAQNTWGLNNLTINGNGNNIGDTPNNVAPTFPANFSNCQFSIEASGTYWRLI